MAKSSLLPIKICHKVDDIKPRHFKGWRGKKRLKYAQSAIKETKSEGLYPIVVWQGDEFVAIAALSFVRIKGYVEVSWISSKRRGFGTIVMKEVWNIAEKKKKGVTLISDPGALGFYRKIKMREDHLFSWVRPK